MQLKSFVLFTLLGGAIAQGAGTLQTIQSSLTAIGAALDTLDTAVKGITDGNVAAQAKDLTTKSSAVEAAIKKATTDISGAGAALSLGDATQVSTAANSLLSKTDSTINGLIAKKDLISKAGQAATVKQQLTAQKTAADALANAIVGKMPALAQSIAKSQAAKIGAAIDKGVAAF